MLSEPANDRAVDLQEVDLEVLREGERRVTRSEIVDGQPHAHLLELSKPGDHGLSVSRQSIAGDLQVQVARMQPGLLQDSRDVLPQVRCQDLLRGEVDAEQRK